MTQQLTVHLPRGTLQLSYQTQGHYELSDLLGFAERINPKRAFLFVSKVLGRHIPVAPKQMREAFSRLANLLPDDLPEPILVVGMAETAVGLSAGVHQVLQSRYPQAILLNSTRHAQSGALLAQFSEDHSHASYHLLYQANDPQLQNDVIHAKSLIVVDDEASTGRTCYNVVEALRQAGLQWLEQVHLATLVDWSLDNAADMATPHEGFYRHHLLAGHWQWYNRPNNQPINMPKLDTTAAGNEPILPSGQWGRFPTKNSTQGLQKLWHNLKQRLAEVNLSCQTLRHKKVLVLGSNEFVWLPFLLAERLEQQAISVKFSALTRSPIAVSADSAIQTVLTFADNYGLGMTNFVYNVDPLAWDYIILCIETPLSSVDKLWQTLPNVLVINHA